MPSMSSPASLNMPFCSATAQGSVATRRPYWLTVIFAPQAGVTAKVITAVASAAWNHMDVSPVYACVDRRDRCVRKPCTLGFPPPARSPRAATKESTRRTAMRIVHGDQGEEKIRIHQHRQGMFRHRTVGWGEPGTPGNFILEMVRTTDDFFSPRHKHNFDQFRYQLEGEFDFDRNGKMTPGAFGYFPEGTPYGPQSSSVNSLTLVLQFGGASGNGYMTQEQLEAGIAELKKHGAFEKGVFHRNEGEAGKRNVDGYQAVWEHVHKRPMNYPAQRYHDPVMMAPEHFDWVPVEGAPGVCAKLMGVFTERGCEARFLRLAPAARFSASGRKLYFVLTGDGRAGTQPYRRHTTIFCERGDEAALEAETPTEVLVLGLPRLATATPY